MYTFFSRGRDLDLSTETVRLAKIVVVSTQISGGGLAEKSIFLE